MAFCSNCGSPLPSGNNFCPNCGAKVDEYAPVRSAAEPDSGTAPTGSYRANIKKRDIVVAIILSLVTCGIYGIIWFYNLINDLNTAAQTPEDQSAGIVILLTIVTFGIYGWVWLYKAGEKIDKIKRMNGENSSDSAVLYLILAIVGLAIVDYCLIQSELNKVAMDA